MIVWRIRNFKVVLNNIITHSSQSSHVQSTFGKLFGNAVTFVNAEDFEDADEVCYSKVTVLINMK